MPELLGPTNPVPGYESTASRPVAPTPNDPGIQNIVDPGRVVRTDGRADANNTQDTASYPLRYESNFLTFVQRLRDTPGLTETLSPLLFRQGTLAISGMHEGISEEMARFLEMLRMDESQLLGFLMNQMKSASRFGGALFGILRDAYASAQSEMLKNDILHFLRKYSDFSSTAHIEENLLRNLYEMAKSLPSRWANPLLSLTAELENGIAAGDRGANVRLLRERIFSLMANFVGQTHDLGRARGLLSRLTLDLVRYENGSPQDVISAFRRLSGFGVFRDGLGDLSDEALLRMLRETDFFKAAQSDLFAGRLSALAAHALGGKGGVDLQEAFRDIVAALLVNESVYMPVSHLMLPLEWNGRMMFSELWVDPDAEDRPDGDGRRSLRILLKMDIQDLGMFDVLINARAQSVSLQVACPERIESYAPLLMRGLTDILVSNGLKPETVRVAAMKRPLTISEVFPRILERKNSVNVKI